MTAGFSLRFNGGLSEKDVLMISVRIGQHVLQTTSEWSHQNNQQTSAERALTFLQLYDEHCNFHFAEIKYTGATAAVT